MKAKLKKSEKPASQDRKDPFFLCPDQSARHFEAKTGLKAESARHRTETLCIYGTENPSKKDLSEIYGKAAGQQHA